MSIENEIIKLPNAVGSWLQYQHFLKRDTLFCESYLLQPIGEFLSFHHNGEIVAEYTFQNLFQSAKRGRPKQIDFVLKKPEKKDELHTAIETKWVGGNILKQKLVNDLMRLEAISQGEGKGVKRYFLIAGKKDNIKELLENQINVLGQKRTTFLDKILPIAVDGKHNISVESFPQGSLQILFKSFANEYGVNLPKSYSVELISDFNYDAQECRILMWQIHSSSNRTEFELSNWNSVDSEKREVEDE